METALITGTTSGIGRAFADEIARRGYGLILVSRSAPRLREQERELAAAYGVPVTAIPCDLSEADAAESIWQAVRRKGLLVDVLINNAGYNEAGPFARSGSGTGMLAVNAGALTALTRLVLSPMLERGSGRILNVASTGAFMPCPDDAVYAATKAYVLSFSQALAGELRGTGVSVTCLCPGATRTLFAGKAGLEDTPLFRRGVMEPEAVARLGVRRMLQGRRTVVPGLRNKLLVFGAKLLPAAATAAAARRVLRSGSA